LLCACALTISGCQIYRVDVHQGQLEAIEDVDKLQVGMTRDQVADALGTPLIVDKFRDNRWDYVYSISRSGSNDVFKKRVTVMFDGDVLTQIIVVDAPSQPSVDQSE